MKTKLAWISGIVIILADLYWTYTSYVDPTWLALGVIIFVFSVLWLYADFG